MNGKEILKGLSYIDPSLIEEAEFDALTSRRRLFRRPLLIAAIIAMTVLLAGCTVAYTIGWFTDFFAARSEEPLSSEQIEFIQENEQIIMETQIKGEWTVELKSAICDGGTGYILFGITAPEDVELEGHTRVSDEQPYISIGNFSRSRNRHQPMVTPSTGISDKDLNYIWQEEGIWQEDGDGLANTVNYCIEIRCEKAFSDREMLLEDPFGPDVEFTVIIDGFTWEYVDPEIQKKIDDKYAGMTDYMVEPEDMVGLHKSDTLTDEQWQFTVSFATPQNSVELITGEPVTTWAQVFWRIPADNPMGYDISDGLATVKIKSFVLNPFGATLAYEYFEEAHNNASIEYESHTGYTGTSYTERRVFAVMKDGSQIALHTDYGDTLKAETPIVLSEVDHILLGDGVQIPMPE